MTEKRFDIQFDGVRYFCVVDVPNERCVGRFDTMSDAKGYLELYEYYIELQEKNDELKQENERLKELLRKAEHELTSITGLIATDSRTLVKEDMENYDLFRLDCSELVNEIEKELIE